MIGTALVAHAQGKGAGRIVAELGRTYSTVRGWISWARGEHAERLYRHAVQSASQVDPDVLNLAELKNTTLGYALNILVGTAIAWKKRFKTTERLWALIGHFAQGPLLGPPVRT